MNNFNKFPGQFSITSLFSIRGVTSSKRPNRQHYDFLDYSKRKNGDETNRIEWTEELFSTMCADIMYVSVTRLPPIDALQPAHQSNGSIIYRNDWGVAFES